jgi:hypothetical protein
MKCIVVNAMAPREEFAEDSHILHFACDYNDLDWQSASA